MEASNLIGYEGSFATRLRELMKKAKVTQQDLAAAVGTTRQAISQYADGSVQPNIEKLYKIAEFFHVSADYLLGMSNVASSAVDIKAINKMLGLSEKAINELKSELDDIRLCVGTLKISNIDDAEECLQKWNARMGMAYASIINLLLEDPYQGEDTIMGLLGEFFQHERDLDPDAVFVMSKSVIDEDKDECVEEVIPNTTFLTDTDVLAIRLLKLQQALMRYKNELDEQKINGDK